MRSNEREIRLLNLLPGRRHDVVRCTTRVVSLDEHPEFETVSYVWGDRSEDKTIDVSGTSIAVTQNLFAGLLRLRHETSSRALWIDQICINQWDLEEKAAQVALMRDIYRKCTRCITWLGEIPGALSDISCAAAEAVFEFLQQSASAKETPLSVLPTIFRDTEHGVAAREAFTNFAMYGNPWWSRIWTVQEAIIPSSGLLMWGPLCISREIVTAAARNLRDLDALPSLPEGFVACRRKYTELLRRLLYPIHGFRHSKTDSALELLMRWRHREFTDPRDKVYALLGLMSPQVIPSALSCDYTTAVPNLFAKVTLDLIKHEQGLRPLLGACEMPHLTPNTATWAIDLARCNRIGKRQLKWWGHSHRYREFSAGSNQSLELVESSEDNILGLTGINVDEVLWTTELLRVDAHDSVFFDDLRQPLLDCTRLLEQYKALEHVSSVYKDGFSWDSAFYRTLVGDLIMDETPLGRIAILGHSQLMIDYEELWDKLQIPRDRRADLDFLASASVRGIAFGTPTPASYSPEPPSDDVRGDECHSPSSPHYSPTSSLASNHSFPDAVHEVPTLVPLSLSPSISSQSLQNSPRPETVLHPSELSNDPWWTKTAADYPGASSEPYRREHRYSEAMEIRPHFLPSMKKWLGQPGGNEVFVYLYESLIGMMENQTFFITKSGYVGIGPPHTSAGDQVWVFKGGNVPFIMRNASAQDKTCKQTCKQFSLVGDAYVHGIMDGEAWDGQPYVESLHIV